MKSHEWLGRALESTDPIEQLSNSWRGFNGLYSSSDKISELDKIKRYLDANLSDDVAAQLIENHEREIDYLISTPVIDMRGNGNSTAKNIDAFKTSIDSLERIKSIFCVIYQVRCNLEHGQKSPTSERDVELCVSSWPFVAEVIDKCK